MGALTAPPVRLIRALHDPRVSVLRWYALRHRVHIRWEPLIVAKLKRDCQRCFVRFLAPETMLVPRFTKTADSCVCLHKSAHRPVLGLSAEIQCATVAGLRLPGGPSPVVFHNCGRNCGNPGNLHKRRAVNPMLGDTTRRLGTVRGVGLTAPSSGLIRTPRT